MFQVFESVPSLSKAWSLACLQPRSSNQEEVSLSLVCRSCFTSCFLLPRVTACQWLLLDKALCQIRPPSLPCSLFTCLSRWEVVLLRPINKINQICALPPGSLQEQQFGEVGLLFQLLNHSNRAHFPLIMELQDRGMRLFMTPARDVQQTPALQSYSILSVSTSCLWCKKRKCRQVSNMQVLKH